MNIEYPGDWIVPVFAVNSAGSEPLHASGPAFKTIEDMRAHGESKGRHTLYTGVHGECHRRPFAFDGSN